MSSSLRSVIARAGRLATGTIIGQGLVFLATPYLSRHYTPTEYGTLALLMTVTAVSASAACARYDLAIPSSAESEVQGLIQLSMGAALLCAVLVLLGILIAQRVAPTPSVVELSRHVVIVPICVFLVGAYQVTNALLLRRGRYNSLMGTRISQGALFSGLAAMRAVGLLWAHLASWIAGFYALMVVARRRGPHSERWAIVARTYVRIPALSLPGGLLDAVAFSLCVWILTDRFGGAVAGNYSQIQRLVGAPLLVVSMSLGQILLKQTADLGSDVAAIRRLLRHVAQLVGLGSIAAIVFLWFFGSPLLHLLLGNQWRTDRAFIAKIAVAVAARAIVSPLSAALLPMRRYDVSLRWSATYFCSTVIVLGILSRELAFDQFMLVYACHELCLYGLYFGMVMRATPWPGVGLRPTPSIVTGS